ncbi:MAG: S24 family peptidase [Gemmatimonadaceae bacterium]
MDAPRAALTPVERKLWQFLIDFLATHTYQPSVREIARHFRIPSTRTVTDLIGSLETKGYVRRTPGRSRGVVITGFAGGVGTQPVPVVRFTAGGTLVVEHHLTLDRALLPGDEAFLVRSTVEDAPAHAVREGDLLLVHPGARAADEAPVVARVGAAILARTLVHRGATLILRAPRPDADDVELGPGDDFAILGPLSGVFRLTAPRPDDDTDDDPAGNPAGDPAGAS